MSIFSSIKHTQEVVILDIGSGSIGGSIVKISANKKPEIIYQIRKNISLYENFDYDRFVSTLPNAIEDVCRHLVSYKKVSYPNIKVFCILASPWYASQIKTLKISGKQGFVLNDASIDNLIESEVKTMHKQYYAGINTHNNSSPVLIETRVNKVLANGYEVSGKMNLTTTQAEVSTVFSISPSNIIHIIGSSVQRIFSGAQIKYNSFPLAYFEAIITNKPELKDILILDIGGEITDVCLIRNNKLTEIFSFPVGKNTIIRSLSNTIKRSPEETKSILNINNDNHLKTEDSIFFKRSLEKEMAVWNTNMNQVLSQISGDKFLPENIIFVSDNEVAKSFKETMEQELFNQYFLNQKKFNVINAGSIPLGDTFNVSGKSDNDLFLNIETIFVHNSELINN